MCNNSICPMGEMELHWHVSFTIMNCMPVYLKTDCAKLNVYSRNTEKTLKKTAVTDTCPSLLCRFLPYSIVVQSYIFNKF